VEARGRDLAPGEVLAGRWTIERVIGRGGMGVVVAAFDRRTGTRVAVKLMHDLDSRNALAVERFFREARAAMRIVSPYVTRVIEAARLDDGRPYMAMELLEGSDLARVLKIRGTFPIHEAVRYLREAANGCAIAHAAGVVHRDLKPANLFVVKPATGSPSIKLLDFGISKLSGLSGTAHHALTAEGDLTGSPLYMPPEQLRAREVDARADIWALGATLFELLTGRRPFQADNMLAECNRILMEAPPVPSQLRTGVPPGLDAVVLRCLEKEPQARFATAKELADALAPFDTPTVGNRRPKKSGGRGVAIAFVVVAAVTAGALYAFRFRGAFDKPVDVAPPSDAHDGALK
jgi:serine/threonine protein kinase